MITRVFTFCSQHKSRSINLITLFAWMLPLIVFTTYFSSIQCQGFLSPDCSYFFLVSKRYRLLILFSFLVPLLLMFLIYVRIFFIIKRNAKSRRILTNHQMPKQISVSATEDVDDNVCIERESENNNNTLQPRMQLSAQFTSSTFTASPLLHRFRQRMSVMRRTRSLMVSSTKSSNIQNSTPNNKYSQALLEPASPKLHDSCTSSPRINHQTWLCCDCHSSRRKPITLVMQQCDRLSPLLELNNNCEESPDRNQTRRVASVRCTAPTKDTDEQETDPTSGQTCVSNRINREPVEKTSGHTKALCTTLIILGTYLVCWMPALCFLVLTCVDGCPYPLFAISVRKRVILSFINNSLVIMKSMVDPFIYIYRIKEVKQALRRSGYFFCAQTNRAYSCSDSRHRKVVNPSAVDCTRVSTRAETTSRTMKTMVVVDGEHPNHSFASFA